jgi:TonB family protein
MKYATAQYRLAALLLVAPAIAIPAANSAPALAAQPSSELAADSCVSYSSNGSGGYQLVNLCDYALDIAFCAEPKDQTGFCLTNQSWTREKLSAKAQGLTQLKPGSALDLFACRQPATVEILPSGMARCTAGAGPAPMPLLPTAALKNPGTIITNKDYPASQHNKEGTTRFDLIVGPDGKPVSCTTTVSSGFELLDKTACNAFLKRARFSPAKDGNGNAVTGRYKGSVTWKAP